MAEILPHLKSADHTQKQRLANTRMAAKLQKRNDAQINIPDQHNFESEGEVKESTLRRTIEGRTR
jgi:hypothetical protein